MLALVFNNALVSLVTEGSVFEHTSVIDDTGDNPETITVTTGPAYDGWSGDGYSLYTIAQPDIPEGHYLVTSDVRLVAGVWTEAGAILPIPVPVPYSISKKQFYMQGAYVGMCTHTEALNAITIGTLPAALQVIIDGMSNEDAKWEAKMQMLGSNEFYRDSPWVLVVATVLNWTEDQIDDFWTQANER